MKYNYIEILIFPHWIFPFSIFIFSEQHLLHPINKISYSIQLNRQIIQIFSGKKYTKHYTGIAPSHGDTQGLLSFHLFKCISDTNLPNWINKCKFYPF